MCVARRSRVDCCGGVGGGLASALVTRTGVTGITVAAGGERGQERGEQTTHIPAWPTCGRAATGSAPVDAPHLAQLGRDVEGQALAAAVDQQQTLDQQAA